MIIKLTQAHILGAFISYLLGVFIVPFVIDFSQKEGLVDVPNERKIHKTQFHVWAGVAIWTSTMLTFFVSCLVKLLSLWKLTFWYFARRIVNVSFRLN